MNNDISFQTNKEPENIGNGTSSLNNVDLNLEAELNSEVSSDEEKEVGGGLQSKNIRIHKRRTSVRLEPEMWSALREIAAFENCSIHDLCGAVHDLKEKNASFTASLRVFMMEYYRAGMRRNTQVSQIQQRLKDIR